VSSPDPGLGLRRGLRLAQPWARTDHAAGGHIIALPLASSGYGGTRPASHPDSPR
jgi:hypothetical protein